MHYSDQRRWEGVKDSKKDSEPLNGSESFFDCINVPNSPATPKLTLTVAKYYSWRSKKSDPGAQIDMLIERADGIIDVCEMKYSRYEYRQDKDDSRNLANKIADFEEETNTKYNIQTVLITTWGMKENLHSDEFQKVLTMNDLFVENTEDS